MPKQKHDELTVILNKVLAMKKCGMFTLRQIAKAIGEPEQHVSMWVTQRTRRPTAPVAFKLQDFASRQTILIATNRKIQPSYRAAYRDACMAFPVNGKNETLLS